MDTHSSHRGIKNPGRPAGRLGEGAALVREEARVGAASAIDDGRYPLCRLSGVIALALNMSGGLFFGLIVGKHFRADDLQIHFAGRWNAIDAPLGHCALGDTAKPRHGNGAAQVVDDFGCRFTHDAASIVRSTKKSKAP